jgi:hypothetical protein
MSAKDVAHGPRHVEDVADDDLGRATASKLVGNGALDIELYIADPFDSQSFV